MDPAIQNRAISSVGKIHTASLQKEKERNENICAFSSCAFAVVLIQTTDAILFSVASPPGRHALDVLRFRFWIAGEQTCSAPGLALARFRAFIGTVFAVRVTVALPKGRYAVAVVAGKVIRWTLVILAVFFVGTILAVIVAITSKPHRQALVMSGALEFLRRTGTASIHCLPQGERFSPRENRSEDE